MNCFKPITDIVPFGITEQSILLNDKLIYEDHLAMPNTSPNNQEKKSNEFTYLEKDIRREQLKEKLNNISLPKVAEWLQLEDKKTGKTYYHNKSSNKSVWKKPKGFDTAKSIMNINKKREGSYWIKVKDSKERIFYYDLCTQKTSWEKPDSYIELSKKGDIQL